MSHDLVVFEWTCPLCGESKISLVAQHQNTIEGLAKNALAGHIRGRNDDAHSSLGKYPEDFDPTDVLQYIKFGEKDQAREVPNRNCVVNSLFGLHFDGFEQNGSQNARE